jgi:hypothetical protein
VPRLKPTDYGQYVQHTGKHDLTNKCYAINKSTLSGCNFFQVLLERISSKRIWFVILVNILVLSVIVGVSTRYGSQINHVELLGQQRVAHGNSTVDMQLQVRDMMPSHRHMNIDVYFEQNELRAAKYCKDNVETSLCQDLTHFMKTPYASSSDFFSNSFDSDR